jgi:hypothetical protein
VTGNDRAKLEIPMADFGFILKNSLFRQALTEQEAAVEAFWQEAGQVLEGSGVKLKKLPPRLKKLRHNYFSVLFAACLIKLGIKGPRLSLYVRINHCLRAWVTACDNLLDNELKEMIQTDLPEAAHVFKSVHTLLVTDRVFFSFVFKALNEGIISREEVSTLVRVSLAAITESGKEEAGEEGGISFTDLTPEQIIGEVHSLKAGKLFLSPLAAPDALGDIRDREAFGHMQSGLYHFGIACQILDDLADLAIDMQDRKHNYLAAQITSGRDRAERELFTSLLERKTIPGGTKLYRKFPEALANAREKMTELFTYSLDELKLGGLPFGGTFRSAFLKGLGILYRQPEIMARMRS